LDQELISKKSSHITTLSVIGKTFSKKPKAPSFQIWIDDWQECFSINYVLSDLSWISDVIL